MPVFQGRGKGLPLEPPTLPTRAVSLPDPRVMTSRRLAEIYRRFSREAFKTAGSTEIQREAVALVRDLAPNLLASRVDGEALSFWLTVRCESTLESWEGVLVIYAELGMAAAAVERSFGWAHAGQVDEQVVNFLFLMGADLSGDLPARIGMVGEFLLQAGYYVQRVGGREGVARIKAGLQSPAS
jgi:hypothetical protein